MWKKLGLGAILVLLVAGGVGYYLYANLDSFVKSAIEKYGSAATQTKVAVGSVDLSLGAGTGSIANLTIANPPGYKSPEALRLAGISIALDKASLAGNGPIIIDNLTITNPQVTYEVLGIGQGSNLQAIESNIQDYVGGGAASPAPGQAGPPARLEIIRNLTIADGVVTVLAPALSGKSLTQPLPPIHLTDLGGPNGGTPAQIGAQIVRALTDEAAGMGATALINHAIGSNIVPPAAGGLLKNLLGN